VIDMSQTIAPKSDQLNADDLISGPRTITVTRVSGNEGSAEQPVNVFFQGDNGKPFRPCKSMRRVMVAVWGPDAATYAGRSMTLFRDPSVAFGGMQVGGIRISHMSHIDKPVTMALTATRASRKPYTVKPMASAPVADASPARVAAALGKDAFRAWWRGASEADKAAAKPIMADLQRIADEADAARDADPFGLPPIPDDVIAAAKAETDALAASLTDDA
jgi:hypothetical protein